MKQLTENKLLESVKRGLDYSAGNLDSRTRVRLTRIRLQALEQNNRSSMFFHVPSLAHGFAAAVVVTLFVTLWALPQAQDSFHMQTAPLISWLEGSNPETTQMGLDLNAMEVLMSTEEMDFLENMDIYEWLDAEYG